MVPALWVRPGQGYLDTVVGTRYCTVEAVVMEHRPLCRVNGRFSWTSLVTTFGLWQVYWITSSSRSSSDGGIVIPSALAVLRLITSSKCIGCSMGKSPGLAPRRILST